VQEQWRLGSLTDYYDYEASCLFEMPKRLAILGNAGRALALETVRLQVNRLAGDLPDDLLQAVSVSMIEDLYKSAGVLTQWDPPTAEYVTAVWATFFELMAGRGYLMHYIVENTFADHLERPLRLFPIVFTAAGIIYVCPHHLATKLPEGAGAEPSVAGLRNLLTEGRYLAEQVATRATRQNQSLMYLEIDYDAGCLDRILSLSAAPGVVVVVRNQAPQPGSTVQVTYPPSSFSG
jgi:hypothetical protein